MPSPERQGGKSPEQEPASYHRAARFAGEEPAGKAYVELQESIFDAQCDLSAYRLQVNRIWHVAVLGEPPPEDLDKKIQDILLSGEPVSLPAEVLRALAQRRAQAIKKGPWIERHYRPGKPL